MNGYAWRTNDAGAWVQDVPIEYGTRCWVVMMPEPGSGLVLDVGTFQGASWDYEDEDFDPEDAHDYMLIAMEEATPEQVRDKLVEWCDRSTALGGGQ